MIEICNSRICTGCMACHNVCPQKAVRIVENEQGFCAPQIQEDSCIDCEKCRKVCPILNQRVYRYPKVRYAAKRKKKRMLSQSGGVFLALAEAVIRKQGVVYGVVAQSDHKVCYWRGIDEKGIRSFAGSKYVQAYVGNVYQEIGNDLQEGRKVLIGGTACCINGLLNYLIAMRISVSNLITCDIICHGVLSPGILREYIKLVEQYHRKKMVSINYRNKEFGWQSHVISYEMSDGKNYFSSNYVNYFHTDCALNEACYECSYAREDRVSDITIGDCWGIDKVYVRFDDNWGCSLVMINTENGKQAFSAIEEQFIVALLKETECLQNNLLYPTAVPESRDKFWNDVKENGIENTLKKFSDFDMNRDERIFLGFLIKNKLIRIGQRIKRKILHDYI